MRTSVKKARGRPRGRTAPHRPVLSVRVPEELYERIQTSARDNGRTVSEEAVWRTQQSYEWETAFGSVRAILAESRRATDAAKKLPLERTLRERGYTKVHAVDGAVWFEPGVHAPTWIFANFNADTRILLQEMLDQAAARGAAAAIEKMGKQS